MGSIRKPSPTIHITRHRDPGEIRIMLARDHHEAGGEDGRQDRAGERAGEIETVRADYAERQPERISDLERAVEDHRRRGFRLGDDLRHLGADRRRRGLEDLALGDPLGADALVGDERRARRDAIASPPLSPAPFLPNVRAFIAPLQNEQAILGGEGKNSVKRI